MTFLIVCKRCNGEVIKSEISDCNTGNIDGRYNKSGFCSIKCAVFGEQILMGIPSRDDSGRFANVGVECILLACRCYSCGFEFILFSDFNSLITDPVVIYNGLVTSEYCNSCDPVCNNP